MKVTGIIAECNPLHDGHRYLIRKARSQTCADYIVIALSGDYVQRGAPSVLSLQERAGALLNAGADLVLALPLYAACSGADYFARGSVALMESLGVVTDLAFGSETGDTGALTRAARALSSEETDEFRSLLREGLREGLPYPAARARALTQDELPSTPNDLLATHYLRALMESGSAIRPLAVKRTDCRSASQIRSEMICARGDQDPFLCRDDFSDLLLHALFRGADAGDLTDYLDVSGDLAARILRQLPAFTTFSGFCGLLKTRNYTYTRISRALLHILLGMTCASMDYFDQEQGLCGWIRPIGFRRDAAPLIKGISDHCTVPFLDKLSRAREVLPGRLYEILREELQAELLYDLMAARRLPPESRTVVSALRKPLLIRN